MFKERLCNNKNQYIFGRYFPNCALQNTDLQDAKRYYMAEGGEGEEFNKIRCISMHNEQSKEKI